MLIVREYHVTCAGSIVTSFLVSFLCKNTHVPSVCVWVSVVYRADGGRTTSFGLAPVQVFSRPQSDVVARSFGANGS